MSVEAQETTKKKRKVNRSPKHPALDLETAIEHLETFYQSAWDNAVGVHAACEIWGLSYGSGTGNRTLSALLQFGLLKSDGTGDSRTVKITERGLDIVTDQEGVTEARRKAIRDAALSPSIYQESWDRWGPRLPDDRVMTPVLVRDLGFNPNSTADFLTDFRATMTFADLDKLTPGPQVEERENAPSSGQEDPEETDGGGKEEDERPTARAPMEDSGKDTRERAPARVEDYTIPLRGAGTAVLSLPVPLSQKNYEKLKGWLDWAEDSLVAEGEDGGEGGGS